jgi:hypothetical protein
MPNLWQYESFLIEGREGAIPQPDDIKETLNTYGKTGYQVLHIKEKSDGGLMFILARDTGRPIDEEDEQGKDWLVDVVTTANAHLLTDHSGD